MRWGERTREPLEWSRLASTPAPPGGIAISRETETHGRDSRATTAAASMIPFLTYPLALFALASLPALAAIYILRNRFRRRQVSSLMLWRFRIQSKEGGARIHRLQLPLLFFLELLALALLVTAAAGPHWKLPRTTRPLIVVLDDSFSMRAVADGTSAQARARAFLEKMFRFQPPPSTRLLLAGSDARLLGGAAKSWSEVESQLQAWNCWSPSASIDVAITLASDIGKQQANILVLTDHAPNDSKLANDRLEWHAFGRKADNAAIINAARTVNGDQDRCLLEIANFSSKSHQTTLQVLAGTNLVQQMDLKFAPHDQQRLVFNIPDSAPGIRATIGGDALAEDDAVQLLPPIRKRVRVRVSLTNEVLGELVERTLAATGLRAVISQDPELVIHQSDTSPGSNTWSLNFVVPDKAKAYSGPFIVDSSQPLAEGVELEGVIWAAAPATNSPGEVPIVLAGNVPLVSVREDLLGREYMKFNFDPELSTLQTTPDWPILFWNLLHWRALELPGLRESNARLGTEVTFKTTGEAVAVTWPDGTVKSFPRTSDELALETPQPGIYSVGMGRSTNSFAVNLLSAEESDLSSCRTRKWGTWANDVEERYTQSPMAWIFALAALGILATHLFLLASGKGGG